MSVRCNNCRRLGIVLCAGPTGWPRQKLDELWVRFVAGTTIEALAEEEQLSPRRITRLLTKRQNMQRRATSSGRDRRALVRLKRNAAKADEHRLFALSLRDNPN